MNARESAAEASLSAPFAPHCIVITSTEFARVTVRPFERSNGELHVSIRLDENRAGVAMIKETIGQCRSYRPDELRLIAAKLSAIADDTERQPLRHAPFFTSYRRY